MPKELIYTSAIQGLKQGTRGFCTVAASAGMPSPMMAMLESLSGYRHLYQPNTPDAINNPVIYSHLLVSMGGSSYHLLSRIADAGLDYSGRTNKIADHIIPSTDEIAKYDIVSILRKQDLFHTSWTDSPQTLTESITFPERKSSARICATWQKITGDAGWAAALALAGEKMSPVCLVYRTGQDVLDLILEALALLPADLRWKITFSTFYTKCPPDIKCLWRAVMAGTPEETALRGIHDMKFIDIASLGQVPDATNDRMRAYLQLARTGIPPRDFDTKKTIVTMRVPGGGKRIDPNQGNEFFLNSNMDQSLGKFAPSVPEKGDFEKITLLDSVYSEMGQPKEPGNNKLLLYCMIFFILCLLGLGGIWFYFEPQLQKGTDSEPVQENTESKNTESKKKTFFQNKNNENNIYQKPVVSTQDHIVDISPKGYNSTMFGLYYPVIAGKADFHD